MEVVAWSHVDIEARREEEDKEASEGVKAVSHNGALAESEVPNLLTKLNQQSKHTYLLIVVVREAEAALFAHALEAATAAMHCVFGQKEHDWEDDETEKPVNHERYESH